MNPLSDGRILQTCLLVVRWPTPTCSPNMDAIGAVQRMSGNGLFSSHQHCSFLCLRLRVTPPTHLHGCTCESHRREFVTRPRAVSTASLKRKVMCSDSGQQTQVCFWGNTPKSRLLHCLSYLCCNAEAHQAS